MAKNTEEFAETMSDIAKFLHEKNLPFEWCFIGVKDGYKRSAFNTSITTLFVMSASLKLEAQSSARKN